MEIVFDILLTALSYIFPVGLGLFGIYAICVWIMDRRKGLGDKEKEKLQRSQAEKAQEDQIRRDRERSAIARRARRRI